MQDRVLLLTTANSYRAQSFRVAAEQAGVEALTVIDMPQTLAQYWNLQLGLDFADLDSATRQIVAFAADHPLKAIIAVDDSGSMLAAQASAALGLPHNSPESARAARNKHVMRTLMQTGGVRVPEFRLCTTADPPAILAQQVAYPCVVKPLELNGSRGVIRADNPDQCIAAITRLAQLLNTLDPSPAPKPFLIERFIPGFEVALEGILNHGSLTVLALFDKPDPLDGPFFEETIYVTPSRLPDDVQAQIRAETARAAAALGLREGPVHAELRINSSGPWIVELAGRSIGGLCSQTLQFGTAMSLEALILRQACGREITTFDREGDAGGVMMIPIPGAGILKGVTGLEDAAAVTGITGVEITARLHYPIVPLPEGESYLGFIFAHAETPAAVEAALRAAHAKLHFQIVPTIPLSL